MPPRPPSYEILNSAKNAIPVNTLEYEGRYIVIEAPGFLCVAEPIAERLIRLAFNANSSPPTGMEWPGMPEILELISDRTNSTIHLFQHSTMKWNILKPFLLRRTMYKEILDVD